MFDFIGDIHGCAGHLLALLAELGYEPRNGVWSHPERKVFFTGDFIDRGGQICETLQIVREMVESGNAVALMGNHEFNAVCFNLLSRDGGYLRRHSLKNLIQHAETIQQFKNGQKEYDQYIAWFRTLPLFYECDEFRAVHACWDADHVKFIREEAVPGDLLERDGTLSDSFFIRASEKGTRLFTVVEELLKGKELRLPENCYFCDKDGHLRRNIRIRWWLNPEGLTVRDFSVTPSNKLPEVPVDAKLLADTGYYREDEKPVFFGHYWLKGEPRLFRDNVCCLDYSVARDGKLVAYRYEGEKRLSEKRFVAV